MVSEGMLPRAAVKEVEARLTAAGCPDADFDARELFRLATGRDVRLSDRPLDAAEAAKLEELAFAVRPGSRCNTSAAAGLSSTLNWPWGRACSVPVLIPRWWLRRLPRCWRAWKRPGRWTSAPVPAVWAWASSGSARKRTSSAWKRARKPTSISRKIPVWP